MRERLFLPPRNIYYEGGERGRNKKNVIKFFVKNRNIFWKSLKFELLFSFSWLLLSLLFSHYYPLILTLARLTTHYVLTHYDYYKMLIELFLFLWMPMLGFWGGLFMGFWWAFSMLLVGLRWAFGGLLIGFWWTFVGLSVGFR